MKAKPKKEESSIGQNRDDLKTTSAKQKQSAKDMLVIAKQQEADKIKNGFHYVDCGTRAKALRKSE